MAIVLTDQELNTVRKSRKNDKDLPTYFSSQLRTNIPISRDFEAFLILATDELKTSATSWIKKAVDLHKVNKDRDELIALATGQELLNAQSKIKVLDERLQNFNEFRVNFQTNSTFAEVPEVQSFIFDLQRVVEELAAARERAQFDEVSAQVVGRADDRLQVTEPQIEQLQSWTGVLSAYLKG